MWVKMVTYLVLLVWVKHRLDIRHTLLPQTLEIRIVLDQTAKLFMRFDLRNKTWWEEKLQFIYDCLKFPGGVHEYAYIFRIITKLRHSLPVLAIWDFLKYKGGFIKFSFLFNYCLILWKQSKWEVWGCLVFWYGKIYIYSYSLLVFSLSLLSTLR